jgi:hypothetical protein
VVCLGEPIDEATGDSQLQTALRAVLDAVRRTKDDVEIGRMRASAASGSKTMFSSAATVRPSSPAPSRSKNDALAVDAQGSHAQQGC